MKYIITDHNKIALGSGCYHDDLSHVVTGNVISAGEMRIENGRVVVFGESHGYHIKAKKEDAVEIEKYLNIK